MTEYRRIVSDAQRLVRQMRAKGMRANDISMTYGIGHDLQVRLLHHADPWRPTQLTRRILIRALSRA